MRVLGVLLGATLFSSVTFPTVGAADEFISEFGRDPGDRLSSAMS